MTPAEPPGHGREQALRRPRARARRCRPAPWPRCRTCTWPGRRRRAPWPNSAACWSPTSAAIGHARGGLAHHAGAVHHRRQRVRPARRRARTRSGAKAPASRSKSRVREALEASVTWAAPSGQAVDEPAVDRAEPQRPGARRRAADGRHVLQQPGQLEGREGRVEQQARALAQGRRRAGRAARRPRAPWRLCHTRARCSGRRVSASQATRVSVWLAMPSASALAADLGQHRRRGGARSRPRRARRGPAQACAARARGRRRPRPRARRARRA